MLTIQSVILGTQLLNGYGLCSAGDRRYTAVGPSLANAAFIAICLVRAICGEFACLLFVARLPLKKKPIKAGGSRPRPGYMGYKGE